jgi:hypothetical protein
MQVDPKSPVITEEPEPSRDAADFMMDAIAGHFAPNYNLPQWTQAPERRRWPVRAILTTALGLVIVTAVLTYARSQFVVLPDYTGMNETQAKSALLEAGLAVTMQAQTSIMVLAHHVIEQTPPAGQWLMKGGTVVLTASTGLPHVALRHHRSVAKPNAHVPSVPSTSPHVRAAAPRIAHQRPVTRPKAIAANTPFGVRSVGGVRVFHSEACSGDNVAVDIRGFPTGCTAFAIASTGKLRHGAGNGLVIPVTVIGHPGEAMYGLMYVTPASADFRQFFGVLVGNGTGHLIVSVHNGLFEAQNGSHAKYAAVVVATPAPQIATASDARETPKPNCPQRSWLQKTVQHVFAPRAPVCR